MCTAVSTHVSQALYIVGGMDICAQTGTWPTHLYGMHFDYPVLSPSETWNEKAVQEYAGFVSDLSYACEQIAKCDQRQRLVYACDIVSRLVYNLRTFGCPSAKVPLTVVLLSFRQVLFGLYYLFSAEQLACLWINLANISNEECRQLLLSYRMLQNLFDETSVDLREHAMDLETVLLQGFERLSVDN